jgi:hypothetical protein
MPPSTPNRSLGVTVPFSHLSFRFPALVSLVFHAASCALLFRFVVRLLCMISCGLTKNISRSRCTATRLVAAACSSLRVSSPSNSGAAYLRACSLSVLFDFFAFRQRDLLATMRRIDDVLIRLRARVAAIDKLLALPRSQVERLIPKSNDSCRCSSLLCPCVLFCASAYGVAAVVCARRSR